MPSLSKNLTLCVLLILLLTFIQCTTPNYYTILQIPKSASQKDIKAAYRKLALKYHPDRVTDEKLKEEYNKKFREISEAYEVLGNEKKRKDYDSGGASFFRQHAGGQRGGHQHYQHHFQQHPGAQNFNFEFNFDDVDPFEMFRQFFGGEGGIFGGSGGQQQRGHSFSQKARDFFFGDEYDEPQDYFQQMHQQQQQEATLTQVPSISLSDFDELQNPSHYLSHKLHLIYVYPRQGRCSKCGQYKMILSEVWEKMRVERDAGLMRVYRFPVEDRNWLPAAYRSTSIPSFIILVHGELYHFPHKYPTVQTVEAFVHNVLTQKVAIQYERIIEGTRGSTNGWKQYMNAASLYSNAGSANIFVPHSPADLDGFFKMKSHVGQRNQTLADFYPQLSAVLFTTKLQVSILEKEVAFRFRHACRFAHVSVVGRAHWASKYVFPAGGHISVSNLPMLVVYNPRTQRSHIIHQVTKKKLYSELLSIFSSSELAPFVHLRDKAMLMDYCFSEKDDFQDLSYHCVIFSHPVLQDMDAGRDVSAQDAVRVQKQINQLADLIRTLQTTQKRHIKLGIASNFEGLQGYANKLSETTKGGVRKFLLLALSPASVKVAFYQKGGFSKRRIRTWLEQCAGITSSPPKSTNALDLYQFPHPSLHHEPWLNFAKILQTWRTSALMQVSIPQTVLWILIIYVFWKCFVACCCCCC